MHITLAKPPLFGKKAEGRNKAICDMYVEGKSLSECGQVFKLSRERVCQILKSCGVQSRGREEGRRLRSVADELALAISEGDEMLIRRTPFESALIASSSMRKFKALDEESQDIVRKMFSRHVKACRSLEVAIDMHFLPDAVYEVGRMARLRK
jgi:hypothetical protein